MSTIAASAAPIAIEDSIEAALAAHLPAHLAAMDEYEDFRLWAPEAYITGPENLDSAFRLLNVDEVACWTMPEGFNSYDEWESLDANQQKGYSMTPMRVVIVAREPAGVKLPIKGSREMLYSEWSSRRAQLFQGALIDVITRYLPDGVNVHEVHPRQSRAAQIAVEGFAVTAQAAVIFEVEQDVMITRSN
jgi:hypothetical protein